jgi:hypothetical protein
MDLPIVIEAISVRSDYYNENRDLTHPLRRDCSYYEYLDGGENGLLLRG